MGTATRKARHWSGAKTASKAPEPTIPDSEAPTFASIVQGGHAAAYREPRPSLTEQIMVCHGTSIMLLGCWIGALILGRR
jgi:hypothetical protein